MSKQPHIVIFNPDQWRGEAMAHMGNPCAVTPNLDEMAATDAVSFRYAFAQNPVCTPSRCSFMTGWYPHVRGHRTMFHMLQPEEPVLLRQLKEAGYFVWWGGKNDLTPGQLSQEPYCDVRFRPREALPMWQIDRSEEWRGPKDGKDFFSFYVGRLKTEEEGQIYRDGDWAVVEAAVELLRDPPQDRPLCLFLALTYPHPPYAVEEPWYSMIDRDKVPPPISVPEGWHGKPSILQGIYDNQGLQELSDERWTELRATYYGMCARVDHQFGMLVDALKDAGIYEDTAIFFFADHGDFTGDYGLVEKTQNTFEDVLCRVPLLVKPPARVDVEPRITPALVELTDFPATAYELAGLEPDYTHFGRSLLPLLEGETDQHRDAVFCEGGRLRGEEHCMELESGSDTEGLYWPRLKLQQQEGPEHSKAVMCRTENFKYVRRLYESDELYDLNRDPEELQNRIADPAYADVLDRLKERLLSFYLETGDVVPHEPDQR